MNRAGTYLQIPQPYCQGLGDLRWAANGEAIEYPEGDTFAFRQEVALFFEGFTSVRRPIHFGFLLHLLALFGHGKSTRSTQPWELCGAYIKTARPLRNAGVLSAILCHRVPPVAVPLDINAVHSRLASGPLMAELCVRWSARQQTDTVEFPPLEPVAFEAAVLEALREFSAEDLEHWLRHGRGKLPAAGETIAREIVPHKPSSLAEALATLTVRPRITGAVPFVAQLVSALTLPPRCLAHQELPLGGYSDVTTRGHPEQLLLSQYALDGLEFVRRFAENELLYFRREEPQAQNREELVVLLDQGVRTWGDVRLVLSAAVLALGKFAVRRKLPFRIAGTSSEGRLLDPLEAEDTHLGELLEASDLTPHPGLALERVLEERPTAARDVVLLTHPRSLGEEDVAAAARRIGPGTRLFVVAVDAGGSVQLVEMKHGTAVPRSRFQVDMTLPSRLPRPVTQPPPDNGEAQPAWQGDVEPYGFPFRFGIVGKVQKDGFAFDQSGEWFLTASFNGMLHLWATNGTCREVLPRGLVRGMVLYFVEKVLGVQGGFVAASRFREQFVAVHYDIVSRQVGAHELGRFSEGPWKWYYFPEYHSVVVRNRALCYGVDLGTGCCYPSSSSWELSARVRHACGEAPKFLLPPPHLYVASDERQKGLRGPHVHLNAETGTVSVRGLPAPSQPFTPEADGQPALKGHVLLEAQCAADTLALTTVCPERDRSSTLRLFHGEGGIPLGEYPQASTAEGFLLSNDGRLLAYGTNKSTVNVRAIAHAGPPVLVTRRGNYHPDLKVELGPHWLTAQVGNWGHLADWGGDRLNLHSGNTAQRAGAYPLSLQGRKLDSQTARQLPFLRYDPTRFLTAAKGELSVVVDRFGAILLFDTQCRLICMFFVFRGQFAAWMPDGTRYGPAPLTGGPATPDAATKLGRALRDAQQRGKGGSP